MKGCFTAIITPFLKEKVDYESLEKLIEYQIAQGIDGLVPCGTTGESPTLSETEKEKVIRFIIEKVGKRVKVIAGTGGNCTASSVKKSIDSKKMGVDAILLVAPYYNKPTQEGLFQHYSTIAKAVGDDVEVILYNIPGRSVINIEIDTIKRLFEIKNITTIKEAAGDVDYASRVLKSVPQAHLLSGNDSLNLPLYAIGGAGCISVVSNIYPHLVKKMWEYAENSNMKDATKLHYSLWNLCESLFQETNPIPIKEACYQKKLIASPELRLPMTRCTSKLAEKIKENITNCDLL